MRSAAAAALGAAAIVAPVFAAAMQPVVDAEWLAEHRDAVFVLHASRSAERLDEVGHIPGAPFIAMPDFLAARETESGTVKYVVPDADAFAQSMRRLGVDADDRVIIAPAGTSLYNDTTVAARLFWQLRYYGHDEVAILDGGVAAWKAAGHPVTPSSPAATEPGNFRVRETRDELLRTTAEIEGLLENSGPLALLDNRPLVQYAGLAGRDYVNGLGHLRGAEPMPFDLFVIERDGAFFWRTPEQVQRLFAALGESDRPVITYCNSGHVSALAWFALSEIGEVPEVSLYDGSLHEWTMDSGRELVIGR
jgi:thiosulfate/3-mercaptopyruvate sulfurtransferase